MKLRFYVEIIDRLITMLLNELLLIAAGSQVHTLWKNVRPRGGTELSKWVIGSSVWPNYIIWPWIQ